MIDKKASTLILGAYGTIGTRLVDLMDNNGYNLLYPTRKVCNLLDDYSYEGYFREYKPKYVINLSGKKTNINLCATLPASICRDTLQMNMNVLEICKKYEVEKLVNVICSCSYPYDKEVLVENEFWDGSPHESILAHGLAKRTIYFLGQAYAKQFKLPVVTIALNNVFGPNGWEAPASLKFLDSLIVKIVNAKLNKQPTVYLWGSGQPRREVHYVANAASDILSVFEQHHSSELINIGTGEDKSIAEWAELIASLVKYKGSFEWDKSKPDGQMSKKFSVDLFNRSVRVRYPQVHLNDALQETIDSYKEHLKNQ